MKFIKIITMGSVLLISFVNASALAGDAPDSTFPKPQHVDNTLRPTIGILGGYGEQIGPIRPAIEYGADFSYQPLVPFGAGIEVTHFQALRDVPDPVAFSFYRTAVLFKGTYNFGGEIPIIRNSYLGLKIGAVFDKEDTSVGSANNEISRTRFAFAPVLGADFMVAEKWSLGCQFSYLFTVGPEAVYDTLSVLAAVKYWF
jgi:hypothetical protein